MWKIFIIFNAVFNCGLLQLQICELEMNPQYVTQQPQQQYGASTRPGFGPPPSGFPPISHGDPRPPPSGTPGGYQLPSGPPAPGGMHSVGPPGPQRMGQSPQGPQPFNSDLRPPSGPVSQGPGMSGFSGLNVMNGPTGLPSGMQSEFVSQN